MPVDLTEHPDAPDPQTLGELTIEPVPYADILRRREHGEALVEDNVRERDDLDVHVSLSRKVEGRETQQEIGDLLYRYTQLFGSPQMPEYLAGEDISWRTDTTFKYLLRVTGDVDSDLPSQWLMTVFDWRVGLGAAVAEWFEDPPESYMADRSLALTSLVLAHNVGSEPIQCEYEGIWY